MLLRRKIQYKGYLFLIFVGLHSGKSIMYILKPRVLLQFTVCRCLIVRVLSYQFVGVINPAITGDCSLVSGSDMSGQSR